MPVITSNGYQLVSALFLRLLGVIYLIAFISIAQQVEGLVGSQGILPFAEKLAYLETQYGLERYYQLPNVFWLNASDQALTGVAIAGCFAAILIIFNRYLSLYHANREFLNFQWDGLLLEAGFLAIFLTPRSRAVVLLFRWLLFRLRFMSGISKLSMNDPTWSGFTALNTYFEVQPLPTPLAWYAHQLPEWLLRFGTGATLVVEILVPFMMFLPRNWRFAAAWITILWQVLIILTSNHNWINFLTIILCLFLFDDRSVQRILPQRFQTALLKPVESAPRRDRIRRTAVGILSAFILVTSSVHLWELTTMQRSSGIAGKLLDYAETYRLVSKYHVFPTMKRQRIELELSGSQDGREWKTYVFKHKPGDIYARPSVVLPFQPRLDWQMWFVTLNRSHLPWFRNFLQALLENSPTVTALLHHNPFPDQAPRYIRVDAYQYSFSSVERRSETGQWWQRETLGSFSPLPWIERI
jgi:hypothetical protein